MEENVGPPQAPQLARRFSTTPGQAVGLVFLMALPIAALAGAFGERMASATAASARMEARISYPERYRFKQINRTIVVVTNRSAQLLDTVTVAFDSAYLLRFSQPQFLPAAREAYAVALTNIPPHQSKLAIVTMQAEYYGRHSGTVRIMSRTDTLAFQLHTFVFP